MASPEISDSDSPSADSRHQVPDAAPDSEHFLDLDEGHATRRGPKLMVAAVGAAWVTMAVLSVTVFRSEFAEVKHVAERAAAIAGEPANMVPFVGAGFGGNHATPPSSSPAAPREAQRAYTVKLPAATPTGAATGTPTARRTPTPKPTTHARPTATHARPAPTPTASPKPTTTAWEPTATASPEPTTTASPEPTTSVSPEPTTTASPEPTTTVSPEPTATASPELTTTASPDPSAGPTDPGLSSSVSTCSQAVSASSIGSIIQAIQACASGLVSP